MTANIYIDMGLNRGHMGPQMITRMGPQARRKERERICEWVSESERVREREIKTHMYWPQHFSWNVHSTNSSAKENGSVLFPDLGGTASQGLGSPGWLADGLMAHIYQKVLTPTPKFINPGGWLKGWGHLIKTWTYFIWYYLLLRLTQCCCYDYYCYYYDDDY